MIKVKDLDLEELMNEITKSIVTDSKLVVFSTLREKGIHSETAFKIVDIVHRQLSDGGGEDCIWDCLMGGLGGHMGDTLRKIQAES